MFCFLKISLIFFSSSVAQSIFLSTFLAIHSLPGQKRLSDSEGLVLGCPFSNCSSQCTFHFDFALHFLSDFWSEDRQVSLLRWKSCISAFWLLAWGCFPFIIGSTLSWFCHPCCIHDTLILSFWPNRLRLYWLLVRIQYIWPWWLIWKVSSRFCLRFIQSG